jgi:predicted RNA-binding Zn ribbon-like protein
MACVERRRDPDRTPRAPGDMELVRGFLSLHDHQGDDPRSLPPSPATLREFFVERGLMGRGEPASEEQLDEAFAVHQALHRRIATTTQSTQPTEPPGDRSVIDRAASAAGLQFRFVAGGPRIEPTAGGVPGAIGRILAVAFVAQLDGPWDHLKECGDEDCTAVFYDRSRNHSGKWCSMQSCGNKNKVRAFRARQRSRVGPA